MEFFLLDGSDLIDCARGCFISSATLRIVLTTLSVPILDCCGVWVACVGRVVFGSMNVLAFFFFADDNDAVEYIQLRSPLSGGGGVHGAGCSRGEVKALPYTE